MTGMDAVQGILFTDGLDRIFLHPPEVYSDGHGFHHDVEIVSGPFAGRFKASSYEDKAAFFRRLRRDLISLYEALSGEASLGSSYENLKLSLKGDGRGNFAVEGVVAGGDMLEARLHLRFSMDQTQLPAIISSIDQIIPR